MFIRVFGVAVTIAALWWSSSSFGVGLGLGEVNVGSSLSSPLEASITLRGMDEIDLDPEQFSIRIDGESRVKIEYRLERVDADTALIHLYTQEPLAEPLIQFRVEVGWDKNAVARTYDVFIDPPAYQQHFGAVDELAKQQFSENVTHSSESEIPAEPLEPIAISEPATTTTIGEVTTEEVMVAEVMVDDAIVDEAAVLEPALADDNSESVETGREYGPTIDGNSIWRVARAVATTDSEQSIYQWMYAIWKANPHAFMGDNMHRLQIGELLQVPLEQEVAEFSHVEAWRVYSSHMALLQPYEPATDDAVEVPAIEMAGQTESQQAAAQPQAAQRPADDALANKPPASDADGFEQTPLFTEAEQEALAVDAALIALLEESATAIEEQAIIITPEVAHGEPAILAAAPIVVADIQAADQPDALAADTDTVAVETVGWYQSLQSRRRYIEDLPVIGAEGSLAFIGRVLQRVDQFVATSPSWATLAFGAWVTLVLMLLKKELQARRNRPPGAQIAKPATATGPAGKPVAAASTGKARREQEQPQPSVQRPPDSNAREIIRQANSILAIGDTEEAIKLMQLAVELQPRQPALVYRLLELYHQTRRREAFSSLVNRSLPTLQMLDPEDKAQLQVIYSRMLPGSEFPLGPDEVAGSSEASVEEASHAPLEDRDQAVVDDEIDARFDLDEMVEIEPPVNDPDIAFPVDHMAEESQHLGVLGSGASEDFTNRYDAINRNLDGDAGDDVYIETQVIFTNNGVPLREQTEAMPSMVGEILDLDVTLKEADVYLAYGLYDNAEELLLKGMEVDPNRTDFLARLLDTYYATQNLVDFVSCAEVMLDMGEAGSEYWDKVEIMGYELAPYNKMFAGGKDRSLSAVELEIARPETADFDFSDIETGGEAAFTEFEIEEDDEDDLGAADLNLDLALSDVDDASSFDLDVEGEIEVSAEEPDEILSLETSEILAISESSEPSDEDGLSFDLDAGGETDDLADELDSIVSLETSEILAIPETSGNAGSEDTSTFDLDAQDDEQENAADTVIEDADDDSGTDLDFDDDEAMKFTIEETGPFDALETEDEAAQARLSVVRDSSQGPQSDSTLHPVDGRILYFPDGSKEDKAINEFESEVRVTLQAIRDQLQHMTERLFRQERETTDLKQAINELKDDAGPKRGKNKKSS